MGGFAYVIFRICRKGYCILGDVSEADLLVDEITGKIDAILLPTRGFMLNRNHDAAQLSIAWQDVRKIGPEIIVVEIDSSRNPLW